MKNALLILFTFITSFSFAQKAQNVYYIKGNEIPVKTKEEAEYTRVIQEPDSGSVLYNLLEFYPDNTKKTLGTVSKFEPILIYEGQLVTFYPNGKRKDVGFYINGQRTGDSFDFYLNGQLKKRGTFEKIEKPILAPGELKPTISKYKLKDYYDSTGVQLVKDGNGLYKTNKSDSEIFEEGAYKDGWKDGIWKGSYPKYEASFEERYENGNLISGNAKLMDGSVSNYTSEETMPEFTGGIKNFYQFVVKKFRYPQAAVEQGISGRLILGFVVEEDGHLSEIKVLKDIGLGTGEAAIDMLEKSPNWKPGRRHGIPVRVQYTLPLSLNFTRR